MAASRRSLGQERHDKDGFKVLPASNISTAQLVLLTRLFSRTRQPDCREDHSAFYVKEGASPHKPSVLPQIGSPVLSGLEDPFRGWNRHPQAMLKIYLLGREPDPLVN